MSVLTHSCWPQSYSHWNHWCLEKWPHLGEPSLFNKFNTYKPCRRITCMYQLHQCWRNFVLIIILWIKYDIQACRQLETYMIHRSHLRIALIHLKDTVNIKTFPCISPSNSPNIILLLVSQLVIHLKYMYAVAMQL